MGGKYLTWLRDSNELLNDPKALKERLQTDGYLLLRDFHKQELVNHAYTEMLQHLQLLGRLDPDSPLEEGIIGEKNKGFGLPTAGKR
jgi:hypothetical protein